MAILYYVDFSSYDMEELIVKYKNKVDSERLSKITRTQPLKARVRSLLGGYLLQIAIKEIEDKEYSEKENKASVRDLKYGYGIKGKPYLIDYPDFHFSLSHSGNVVALAVSDREIGLDVQEHITIKRDLAKRFFTEEEQELLSRQKDEDSYRQLFFMLWSIKESYIKYTGLGMSHGLDSFQIDFDKSEIRQKGNIEQEADAKYIYFEPEELPGYAFSVCTKKTEKIRKIECRI